MRIPIRVRLTAVYCLVFCCSTLILEVGTYWGITAAIYAVVDHDLNARLLGVEEFLNDHMGRRPEPLLQEELRRHEALQPTYLSIVEASGRRIFQVPAMGSIGAAKLGPRGSTVWTAKGGPESLRVLTARRTVLGRKYDLLLATGLTVPLEIMSRARLVLLLLAPVVLLCASLAGYWISGRALAPVAGLTRAARSIGADNLNRQITVPQTGDELQELAVTLNDMLARIDDTFRQVKQFTANASHELRTPLALIRTTSEVALLRTTADANTHREALHLILAEAERNTALLDNLLILARADSGAQILDRRPLDIGQSIQQTCEQMEVLASEKKLRMYSEIGNEPLWVSANADHLRRLWVILLDNAVKYTPVGGEIRVALKSSDSKSVSLDVIDSGIGIAEKDMARIFERFFRADEARTKGVGGTGLGLSIARWIVDAHEATIGVHSTVGQGSTFRIVFPLLTR
jgi:two-component system, OmpR family, heavy metal sensor histidine kinase CusS